VEKPPQVEFFLFPERPRLSVHGTGVPIGEPLQAIAGSEVWV